MREDNQAVTPSNEVRPWGMELNTFCMLLHLSQLAGFIIPGAGFVLPIVMWATNKDQHKEVNLHGLIVFNWMISAIIYSIVFMILVLLLVGILLLIALGIVSVVFAIVGAVKANEGVYWRYPLSIDFFGVKAKLAEQSV